MHTPDDSVMRSVRGPSGTRGACRTAPQLQTAHLGAARHERRLADQPEAGQRRGCGGGGAGARAAVSGALGMCGHRRSSVRGTDAGRSQGRPIVLVMLSMRVEDKART